MTERGQNHSDFELELSSMFDPGSTALLVVDVQEKLWPFIEKKDDVLRRTLQMIEVTGHLEMPILVTEQYVKGLGPTIPQVKEALERFGAYEPMEKRVFSCFGLPELAEKLEEMSIDTLAIIGIEAHVCVMQTALDALDRGLDVFLVAEATGSRNGSHKEEAVRRARDAGAMVGSVEMFGFEAMRTSTHPAFKNVQKAIL